LLTAKQAEDSSCEQEKSYQPLARPAMYRSLFLLLSVSKALGWGGGAREQFLFFVQYHQYGRPGGHSDPRTAITKMIQYKYDSFILKQLRTARLFIYSQADREKEGQERIVTNEAIEPLSFTFFITPLI
jgi:hypothetical protein